MNREEIPVVRNIFIAIMLTTIIAGYSVAHDETPISYAQDNQVVVSTPTSTPQPTTNPQDTPESYIREVFGYEQGERAIQMLKNCENKTLNPNAINWNGNGTWDYGLFQINQVHGYTQQQLADYKFNTRIAYKLYKNAGYQFTPWTCAYEIGETPFYLK